MHIVQSPEWGQFKTQMGTPAVREGEVQYTKHKIPVLNKYYGYCPKVDPFKINWETLKKSLAENNCIAINFDVPNIETTSPQAEQAIKKLAERCVRAPKDTFAKSNVVLDISIPKEEILKNMHKKHRYNIRYAFKNGVVVRKGETEGDYEIFYDLLVETAKRQKYFVHSKSYYQKIWEMFKEKGMVYILIAEHKGKPLTAWMLFSKDGVLYYPYGGSSDEQKNLMHSLAVAWAAVELGKELDCHTFDMWGAADNPEDESDPWYGFTQFKLKFGGRYVKYIDSYDLVLNKPVYTLFNLANKIRWTILRLLK